MKRLSSSLVLFLTLITCARAQIITITFEGTLNATPIPLDSILVMNLTAGGDTMIYFPDNELVLDGTTGLQVRAIEAPVLRNHPNPFDGGTDVLVSTRNSGQAMLTVHDATGREVAAYVGNLVAGQHRFRFAAATPGVHLLTAVQNGERATHRLVALAGETNAAGLTFAGSNSTGGAAKSDRSLFTWTPGDELRYIGYAYLGENFLSAVIDAVPVSSSTEAFEMFYGLACPESPTVTDIDGNVYRAVQIGGQCWMAENLRTSRYRDGSIIPEVTDNLAWLALNTGAVCSYNNDISNDATYGKYYNGYATIPILCPLGWHVPSDVEWMQLETELGMPTAELEETGSRGELQNIGGRMKVYPLWNLPNVGANNQSGFSGLPAGVRSYGNGSFNDSMGFGGYWWSSTDIGPDYAWYRALGHQYGGIVRPYNPKVQGLCVRCLRD